MNFRGNILGKLLRIRYLGIVSRSGIPSESSNNSSNKSNWSSNDLPLRLRFGKNDRDNDLCDNEFAVVIAAMQLEIHTQNSRVLNLLAQNQLLLENISAKVARNYEISVDQLRLEYAKMNAEYGPASGSTHAHYMHLCDQMMLRHGIHPNRD